jgi:PAS domain S-box-containing protein
MRLHFPTQINVFLGTGVLVLAAMGFASYLGVADLAETAHLEFHTQEVLATLENVELINREMESAQRWYLVSGDARELERFRSMRDGLFLALFHVRALTVDTYRQRSRLDALEAALKRETDVLDAAAVMRGTAGLMAAVSLLGDPANRQLGRDIDAQVEQIRAEENRLLAVRKKATLARQEAANMLIGGGSLAAILLVGASMFAIRRYRIARDLAEAQVAYGRERLELSLEGSSLALWDADVRTERIYLDGRWSQMLGGPREETVTTVRALAKQAHPDEREQLIKLALDTVAGRVSEYRVEHRVKDRLGSWRWIQSHGKVVERDAKGRALRLAGTNADISERKNVEEALRSSEAQIRLVTEHVPAMIAYFDENELCRFANRKYAELFGREVPEVVGHHLQSITGPELYHFVQPFIARALGGETLRYERVQPVAGGPSRELEVMLVPHLAAGGGAVGFFVMVSDITQRKALERMKTEFVSLVSHELRTPLTSIVGALGLVTGGAAGELPPEAKPLVDIAARNSERLVLLVNDILDLEKIEAGMMRFRPRPLDLGELVRESLEANRAYAQMFGVRFEFAPPPAKLAVTADPERLMQVMANLMSNAAKFSPMGERIDVSLAARDGWARVCVRDHGPGMSEEFQKSVFRKFAQEDTSDTGRKGGTGLGLAICKAIVERSGGRIGFDSRPGKGTTFWFDLPSAEPSPGEGTWTANS